MTTVHKYANPFIGTYNMLIGVEGTATDYFKKISVSQASLYFCVTENCHNNTIYTVATFLDLSIFILSSILLHAFLLNNLSHSFFKKLLFTHHALHQAARKSCLCSTASMEFIEGLQEETVCLLFSSKKVQGNKNHRDSQQSIFPLHYHFTTLLHSKRK